MYLDVHKVRLGLAFSLSLLVSLYPLFPDQQVSSSITSKNLATKNNTKGRTIK